MLLESALFSVLCCCALMRLIAVGTDVVIILSLMRFMVPALSDLPPFLKVVDVCFCACERVSLRCVRLAAVFRRACSGDGLRAVLFLGVGFSFGVVSCLCVCVWDCLPFFVECDFCGDVSGVSVRVRDALLEILAAPCAGEGTAALFFPAFGVCGCGICGSGEAMYLMVAICGVGA